MKKVVSLAAVIVCSTMLSAGGAVRTETSAVPVSLGDFFKIGAALLDTNDDGVPDAVDVRLVLSERPTAMEIASAANVAARLGFETSAMNLPVPREFRSKPADDASARPSIFIGTASLKSSATSPASLGIPTLKPGEGAVAAFRHAGKPAVAIVGADDDGLNAAAIMF